MKNQMQFGELILAITDTFHFRWNNDGSPADARSFGHPIAPAGFYPLGSVGVVGPNITNLNHKLSCICVKAAEGSNQPLKKPLRFQQLWTDKNAGTDHNGSCWRPVPPQGYVAMGDVFQTGYGAPNLSDVMCVRADLAGNGQLVGNAFWKNSKSHANIFSVWEIEAAPDENLEEGLGLFTVNTILGTNSHEMPRNSNTVNCLKLPITRKNYNHEKEPVPSSTQDPVKSTPPITLSGFYLPCRSIKDPNRELYEKVKSSPFYCVKKEYSYEKISGYHNNTDKSVEITKTASYSKEKSIASRTNFMNAHIDATGSVSIARMGGSGQMDGNVVVSGGGETTGTVTSNAKTVTTTIIVPPNKIVTSWVIKYTVRLFRQDNSEIGSFYYYGKDAYLTESPLEKQ